MEHSFFPHSSLDRTAIRDARHLIGGAHYCYAPNLLRHADHQVVMSPQASAIQRMLCHRVDATTTLQKRRTRAKNVINHHSELGLFNNGLWAKRLRRDNDTPSKPIPIKARVPGSGTEDSGALIIKGDEKSDGTGLFAAR